MHSVTVLAPTKLAVKWVDKSTNEASFQVLRCGPSGTASCSGTALFWVASNTTAGKGGLATFTSSLLTAGKFYCYKVAACTSASVCGAASALVCALAK
jgi:hypothetical protein